MRCAALLLLLALPACTSDDPQRTRAYEELTGQTAVSDSAAVAHEEAVTDEAKAYNAEIVAEYDAASQVPQPNLNMQAMRGMPLPDTATQGWAAKGREHRQHAEGAEHAPAEHAPDSAAH